MRRKQNRASKRKETAVKTKYERADNNQISEQQWKREQE
jgi:hypothetical protein